MNLDAPPKVEVVEKWSPVVTATLTILEGPDHFAKTLTPNEKQSLEEWVNAVERTRGTRHTEDTLGTVERNGTPAEVKSAYLLARLEGATNPKEYAEDIKVLAKLMMSGAWEKFPEGNDIRNTISAWQSEMVTALPEATHKVTAAEYHTSTRDARSDIDWNNEQTSRNAAEICVRGIRQIPGGKFIEVTAIRRRATPPGTEKGAGYTRKEIPAISAYGIRTKINSFEATRASVEITDKEFAKRLPTSEARGTVSDIFEVLEEATYNNETVVTRPGTSKERKEGARRLYTKVLDATELILQHYGNRRMEDKGKNIDEITEILRLQGGVSNETRLAGTLAMKMVRELTSKGPGIAQNYIEEVRARREYLARGEMFPKELKQEDMLIARETPMPQ